MNTIPNEDQYHDRVLALITRLNDTMRDNGDEFSVVINALITMLAMAGKDSTLTQQEYCLHVAVQLAHIMSSMSAQTHQIQ